MQTAALTQALMQAQAEKDGFQLNVPEDAWGKQELLQEVKAQKQHVRDFLVEKVVETLDLLDRYERDLFALQKEEDNSVFAQQDDSGKKFASPVRRRLHDLLFFCFFLPRDMLMYWKITTLTF